MRIKAQLNIEIAIEIDFFKEWILFLLDVFQL